MLVQGPETKMQKKKKKIQIQILISKHTFHIRLSALLWNRLLLYSSDYFFLQTQYRRECSNAFPLTLNIFHSYRQKSPRMPHCCSCVWNHQPWWSGPPRGEVPRGKWAEYRLQGVNPCSTPGRSGVSQAPRLRWGLVSFILEWRQQQCLLKRGSLKQQYLALVSNKKTILLLVLY